MSQIVSSNARTLSQLEHTVTLINSGLSFRLYSNPVTLSPGLLLSDFVESGFAGYARQNTAGKMGAITKVVDGRYESSSSPFNLTVTAASPEMVYGWFIWSAGTWVYAASFPAPIPCTDGRVISVVLALQEGPILL